MGGDEPVVAFCCHESGEVAVGAPRCGRRHTSRMDPRTDEQLIAMVDAFTLRARRVLAHSLVANVQGLEALADGGFFARRKDDKVSIERHLPSEESVESLAARVRPVTLQQEAVHYNKVLNALMALLLRHESGQYIEWCQHLKGEWKSVDPTSGKPTYYFSISSPGEDDHEITDSALALAWFYGDLVHADADQLQAGEKFSIDLRFAAAAVRIAQLAILTRDTYSWVKFLVDEEAIPAGAVAAEAAVVKVEPQSLELGAVYVGESDGKLKPSDDPVAAGMLKMEGPWLGDKDGLWIIRIPWGSDAT